MSPKAADPNVRTALVEAAARLLAEEGPSALTTRRLAREVGASTMAVYTHFGGMDDLLAAISLEGFRRLGRRLDRVKQTQDPVADAAALGRAYRRNAQANPHLFRVMFGSSPEEWKMATDDQWLTLSTFVTLVEAVQRCMDAKRIRPGEPWEVASQLWASAHGIAMLELSGFITHAAATRTSDEITLHLTIGLGDDPAAARRSIGGTLVQ